MGESHLYMNRNRWFLDSQVLFKRQNPHLHRDGSQVTGGLRRLRQTIGAWEPACRLTQSFALSKNMAAPGSFRFPKGPSCIYSGGFGYDWTCRKPM